MNPDIRGTIRKVKKAFVLLGRPSNRAALLRFGVAGSTEHDTVLKSGAVDLIIDVGANRGQFSLAARHFQPTARIVAFEPLASASAIYRRIFRNDERVRFHQCAIGLRRGTNVMHCSGSEDSSSLLPIGTSLPELFPGTQAVGTEKIDVAPLTDFITSAEFACRTLLKIDVQGYELEVLKSAEPLLSRVNRVYVEASFISFYEGQPLADEVIAYLQERNFRLAGFMNPSFHRATGAAVQSDLLFVNAGRPITA